MARPTQDAIDAFIGITGTSQSVALRELEEYGGNLEQAVNAHFREAERYVTNRISGSPPYNNHVGRGHQMQVQTPGFSPLLSAARSFRPSLLLDPDYRRNLLNQIGASVFPTREPQSHVGPLNNGYSHPYYPAPSPLVEDLSRNSMLYGPQSHENVPSDEESHGNEIEEEIIRRAIEASKQDVNEDDELARAISLSLKTAEQEKAIRCHTLEDKKALGIHESSGRAEKTDMDRWKLWPGNSSFQEKAEDVQEQLLWGSISRKELDEAILLEAALFAESPEGNSSRHALHLESSPNKSTGLNTQHVSQSASPSLVAQRLLQKQQDDEYLASLAVDREREMNALRRGETSGLKKEESETRMLEGEELERMLAGKEASLPKEPAMDDENAVTLLVRMQDGSRHGRRFLKSDRLQSLFDFVDIGRAVRPGTYKVVRPYPRRAFCLSDSSLCLNEVGLTNRQEVLFLEVI